MAKRKKLRLVSPVVEIREGAYQSQFETPSGALHNVRRYATPTPDYFIIESGTYEFTIHEMSELKKLFDKALRAQKKTGENTGHTRKLKSKLLR